MENKRISLTKEQDRYKIDHRITFLFYLCKTYLFLLLRIRSKDQTKKNEKRSVPVAKKLKDCFPMIREENELLSLLQEFCFVPFDIFQQIYHDKGIRDRRDAWLFL